MRLRFTLVVLSIMIIGAGCWILSLSRERDQARTEREQAQAELTEANDKLARVSAVKDTRAEAIRQFSPLLDDRPPVLNVGVRSPFAAPLMANNDLPPLGMAINLDVDVETLVGWSGKDATKTERVKQALADRLRSYESFLGRSTKRMREEGRAEDMSFFVRFTPGERIDLDKKIRNDSMNAVESERHYKSSLTIWAGWLYTNYGSDEYKSLMYGVGSNARGPHTSRNPKEGTFCWHYARGNWDFNEKTAK